MNVHKHSEAEFTEYQLPHNRREVFFDCLKLRYGVFVLTGLLLLLFILPFFAVKLYGEMIYANMYEAYLNAVGEEASFDALSQAKILKFYTSLAYIPCLAIFALGIAGAMRVIRQLVWGEGLFFLKDFGAGIKQNGAFSVLTFTLFGVIFALNRFLLLMNTEYPVIQYIPTGLIVLFIIPIVMFVVSLTAVYNNKYSTTVKNAFLLYMKNIPQSLAFTAVLVSAYLLDLLGLSILKTVVMAIAVVFVLPLFIEARFLFDCSVFDKYINKKSYPDYVDKGLFRLTDDRQPPDFK